MLGSAALDEDVVAMDRTPFAYANDDLTRKYSAVNVGLYSLSTAAPSWLRSVKAQIEECATFKAGWDSYAAKPISSVACTAAYRIIRELAARETPIPSVVPTSDGYLQFEWHMNDIDLEIRVLSTTKIEVSFEDARNELNPMEDAEFRYDFRDVKKTIDLLAGR
jgi:hypothetical protein